MINEKIVPIPPYGVRFPTETEMAIDETLKLCGISGEEASMIAIEVLKKLGKSDELPACCRSQAERREVKQNQEPIDSVVFDKIRAEIVEYKDDKVIHNERNEMIDIVLEIIDKYKTAR